jgi:hypothetical protein
MGDAVTWLLQMLADALEPYMVPVFLLAALIVLIVVLMVISGLRANYRRTHGLDTMPGMRHARR